VVEMIPYFGNQEDSAQQDDGCEAANDAAGVETGFCGYFGSVHGYIVKC